MSKESILRQIFNEIETDPTISQKQLSKSIGISVGMINWHIKRCINKGFIKLKQAPARRYLYYITPEGFAEKTKLTADYLQSSLDVFRIGRLEYEKIFSECEKKGWKNIILLGQGELSELAILVSEKYTEIEVIDVISILDLNDKKIRPDAIVATDFNINLEEVFKFGVVNGLSKNQILAPKF